MQRVARRAIPARNGPHHRGGKRHAPPHQPQHPAEPRHTEAPRVTPATLLPLLHATARRAECAGRHLPLSGTYPPARRRRGPAHMDLKVHASRMHTYTHAHACTCTYAHARMNGRALSAKGWCSGSGRSSLLLHFGLKPQFCAQSRVRGSKNQDAMFSAGGIMRATSQTALQELYMQHPGSISKF